MRQPPRRPQPPPERRAASGRARSPSLPAPDDGRRTTDDGGQTPDERHRYSYEISPLISVVRPLSSVVRPPMLPLLRRFATLAAGYDVVLCDVWGVVHNGVAATPEACDALARFRAGGGTVVLITNAPRPGEAGWWRGSPSTGWAGRAGPMTGSSARATSPTR